MTFSLISRCIHTVESCVDKHEFVQTSWISRQCNISHIIRKTGGKFKVLIMFGLLCVMNDALGCHLVHSIHIWRTEKTISVSRSQCMYIDDSHESGSMPPSIKTSLYLYSPILVLEIVKSLKSAYISRFGAHVGSFPPINVLLKYQETKRCLRFSKHIAIVLVPVILFIFIHPGDTYLKKRPLIWSLSVMRYKTLLIECSSLPLMYKP